MLESKKATITIWGDFFQGLIVGLIIGIVVIYLGAKGIIPLPFL